MSSFHNIVLREKCFHINIIVFIIKLTKANEDCFIMNHKTVKIPLNLSNRLLMFKVVLYNKVFLYNELIIDFASINIFNAKSKNTII